MDEKRYGYNLLLENAFRVILGKKRTHGSAGLFSDPKYIKKNLNKWIVEVRKRIIELTYHDERLRERTLIYLDILKENVKKIQKENEEWNIIAELILIINGLLGYDYDGEINRHIIYFQDEKQERHDKIMAGDLSNDDLLWSYFHGKEYQKKIIKRLKQDELTNFKISQILNISESLVKKLSK